MALAVEGSELNHWKELANMMLSSTGTNIPERNRLLLARIMRSINGKISVDKGWFKNDELHYHRTDGLDITLASTATGIKSFAYLQRLLENGYLNEESLLLIDEP